MELQFEFVQEVGSGNYPDLIHLWDNEANLLYIQDGRMRSKYTNTPNGEWLDREFMEDVDVSVDDNIEHFRIDNMGGFGAVGSYKSGNTHKLIIYEYQFDISEYLNSGSIKHSTDSPVSSFSLDLENPRNPNEDYEGNVVIDEHSSLISPGAKVIFKFGVGEEIADFEMGTFYVDRGAFTLLSETAKIDGRNLIGKVLRDQTLDESSATKFGFINELIEEYLKHANLNNTQYAIQSSDKMYWFDFKPNTNVLDALEEIFKLTINWQIRESIDGRIIVGSPSFGGSINSTYMFYRNKDVFSRNIVKDDMESYRRVCIHSSDFSLIIYRIVNSYSGWNLQSNKTLYVQVPDGTKATEATLYADEVASRLENIGKIESFTGPFRPHLQVGDEAIIIDEKGSQNLGLITEITHKFGKDGFYTIFTVDSGGQLGKGRLSDYISQITREKPVGSMGYEQKI